MLWLERPQGAGEEQVVVALDEGKRRAQLVGHVLRELTLHPFQFFLPTLRATRSLDSITVRKRHRKSGQSPPLQRLYRTHRLAQRPGHRLIIQPFDKLQQDNLALVVGEARDGVSQALGGQSLLSGLLGINRTHRWLFLGPKRQGPLLTPIPICNQIVSDVIQPDQQ